MDDEKFFQNKSCKYFPCHDGINEDAFNCMFCYCPLYMLKDRCHGSFSYTEDGIKDCSGCIFPHKKENYKYMLDRLRLIVDETRKQ